MNYRIKKKVSALFVALSLLSTTLIVQSEEKDCTKTCEAIHPDSKVIKQRPV